MKRILSGSAALLLLLLTVFILSARQATTLRFHEDGTFRILQINDFQDGDHTNAKSLAFLNAVLDRYRPDLVVLVGDQLMYGDKLTEEQIRTALINELTPLEVRGIPFLYTFGNHDHDHDATLAPAEQAAIYDAFRMSFAAHNGPDPGTYSNVIYDTDGVTPVMNIYMMDTGQWEGDYMMSGVNAEQLRWYRLTGSGLKNANGGKPLPSLVFQHIPVKETLRFLKEVPEGTPHAVRNKKVKPNRYYILDPNADWVGDRNVMKEYVCCENPAKSTGQYESWLLQGDIIGAFFGHDHKNTFVGRTSEGIVMGYSGGFGFASYGDGDERFARIYDFNKNSLPDYTIQTLYYSQEIAPSPPETPIPSAVPIGIRFPEVSLANTPERPASTAEVYRDKTKEN